MVTIVLRHTQSTPASFATVTGYVPFVMVKAAPITVTQRYIIRVPDVLGAVNAGIVPAQGNRKSRPSPTETDRLLRQITGMDRQPIIKGSATEAKPKADPAADSQKNPEHAQCVAVQDTTNSLCIKIIHPVQYSLSKKRHMYILRDINANIVAIIVTTSILNALNAIDSKPAILIPITNTEG